MIENIDLTAIQIVLPYSVISACMCLSDWLIVTLFFFFNPCICCILTWIVTMYQANSVL